MHVHVYMHACKSRFNDKFWWALNVHCPRLIVYVINLELIIISTKVVEGF